MNFKREHYEKLVHRRRASLVRLAEALRAKSSGKPLLDLMAQLAWNRNPFERGPGASMQDVIYELGGLDGMFTMMVHWANIYEPSLTRLLVDTYRRDFHAGDL